MKANPKTVLKFMLRWYDGLYEHERLNVLRLMWEENPAAINALLKDIKQVFSEDVNIQGKDI
jgi:hypothetical protein